MTELKWNSRVNLEAVKEWIASSVEGAEETEGPIEIYRSNDWGITALFHVHTRTDIQEAVCKVAFLPIFQTSPAIYSALSRLHTDTLPAYINGKTADGLTWLLFRKFSGHSIREEANLKGLVDVARQMGDIQRKFAALGVNHSIPKHSFRQLAIQLPAFIERARNVYKPHWIVQQDELVQNYGCREEELKAICNDDVLDRMKSAAVELCGLLDKLALPYSIDHLDLHSNNAVRKENGKTLIFDFEEAVISCPLFSLEKLLDEAAEFEGIYNGPSHRIDWSNAQLQLRDAYLQALGSGLPPERLLQAFDQVAAIAPIKYAYQSSFFLEQAGWQHLEPTLMAESYMKAHRRIKQLEMG